MVFLASFKSLIFCFKSFIRFFRFCSEYKKVFPKTYSFSRSTAIITMTNLVGSDLDGVLAVNHLDRANYSPFKIHQYYAKCALGPLCRAHMDYIITGRKECFRKVTEKWLHEHNVHYGQLIMFPIVEKKTNKTLL